MTMLPPNLNRFWILLLQACIIRNSKEYHVHAFTIKEGISFLPRKANSAITKTNQQRNSIWFQPAQSSNVRRMNNSGHDKVKDHDQNSEKYGDDDEGNELESILYRYKLDLNLLTLNLNDDCDSNWLYSLQVHSREHENKNRNGPIIAEIFADGIVRFGVITGFKPPSWPSPSPSPSSELSKLSTIKPPLVNVCLMCPDEELNQKQKKQKQKKKIMEELTVDIGQITSIWISSSSSPSFINHHMDAKTSDVIDDLSKQYIKAKQSIHQDILVNQSERAMQALWKRHVGRGRTRTQHQQLTKKQINQYSSNPHLQNILRKANKAGAGMSRLVTSFDAMEHLYDNYDSHAHDSFYKQMVGSEILAQDAKLGGRFRRLSCTFVSATYHYQPNQNTDASILTKSVTLLNGGWIAVDASLRTGAEALKFAERITDAPLIQTSTTKNNTATKENTRTKSIPSNVNVPLKTAADERIAQRLECLAMGQNLYQSNDQNNNEGQLLELDVRQALSAMKLPISPEGARDALLRIGRWSITKHSGHTNSIEPWSNVTINAARELVLHEQTRQIQLFNHTLLGHTISQNQPSSLLSSNIEHRIDLTLLPAVCIDAKTATFRDDAIGVRPRSMTGRKLIKEASKWEILIHITDVSDIYSPLIHSKTSLFYESASILRKAAEHRGLSRYDLPLGPLHLLPPIALKALAFDTNKILSKKTEPLINGVNRCVTLWAYIDERNGQLLDIGLERTLISNPIAFTFSGASDLLDGKNVLNNNDATHTNQIDSKSSILSKSKALMAVVERNLSLWSTHHQNWNEAARKREKRMTAKELISNKILIDIDANNSSSSFQRTRGHRIVDSALDLYAFGLDTLLRKKQAYIPRASGSGADRGGRLGTAPLRRYIDGMAQRQALSVLCDGYGGPPMTRGECNRANQIAGKASNALTNYMAVKGSGSSSSFIGGGTGAIKTQKRQREALRSLARHLATNKSNLSKRDKPLVQAISTGRQNEVAILGSGAVAKCKGVEGSLKLGEQVLVEVLKLDPEKLIISVRLCKDSYQHNNTINS